VDEITSGYKPLIEEICGFSYRLSLGLTTIFPSNFVEI
jgi:hypothetical protein